MHLVAMMVVAHSCGEAQELYKRSMKLGMVAWRTWKCYSEIMRAIYVY